jgi:hypothetical protein
MISETNTTEHSWAARSGAHRRIDRNTRDSLGTIAKPRPSRSRAAGTHTGAEIVMSPYEMTYDITHGYTLDRSISTP